MIIYWKHDVLPLDIIKAQIDKREYFDFSVLPVQKKKESGDALFLGIYTTEFQIEVTAAYWVNRLLYHFQNPIELKDGLQLEDFDELVIKGAISRLDKKDFDLWLPIYEYVKTKEWNRL